MTLSSLITTCAVPPARVRPIAAAACTAVAPTSRPASCAIKAVQSPMVALAGEFEVLNPVVVLNIVPMVDDFGGEQRSSEMRGHNQAMLGNVTIVYANPNVAVPIPVATAFPGAGSFAPFSEASSPDGDAGEWRSAASLAAPGAELRWTFRPAPNATPPLANRTREVIPHVTNLAAEVIAGRVRQSA